MVNRVSWAGVTLAVTMALGVSCVYAAPKPTHGEVTKARQMVVGYFPQWGIYGDPKFVAKALVTSGNAARLDQMNYAQGSVAGGRCSVADAHADLQITFKADESVDGTADGEAQVFRGNLHQVEELKRRYPKLKVLISLEGRASDFASDAQPESREAFVASCVELWVKGNFAAGIVRPGLFDGIDMDWEFPHAEDAANFVALLKEMRRQMNEVRPGLRLTIAVGPNPRMYAGTDMAEVAKLVDEIGVMNYDYNGPWDSTTGFLAPLHGDPSGGHGGTVERSIAAYRDAGVPVGELLMGLPFYGYGWSGVSEKDDGLYQDGKAIRGDRPYWYIEALGDDYERHRDEKSGAAWRFDGDAFWTYEDTVSAELKGSYAREQGLGGVMIWELSGDSKDGALLRAARLGVDGAGSDAGAGGEVTTPASGGGRAPR
jgi:chitinase